MEWPTQHKVATVMTVLAAVKRQFQGRPKTVVHSLCKSSQSTEIAWLVPGEKKAYTCQGVNLFGPCRPAT